MQVTKPPSDSSGQSRTSHACHGPHLTKVRVFTAKVWIQSKIRLFQKKIIEIVLIFLNNWKSSKISKKRTTEKKKTKNPEKDYKKKQKLNEFQLPDFHNGALLRKCAHYARTGARIMRA